MKIRSLALSRIATAAILFALAMAPALSEAAVTVVQAAQNSASGPAVTSFAKAFTSSVTAGNIIYAACEHSGLGGINAPTDTLGNTYTQLGTTQNNGTLGQLAQFWTHSTTGGADTVTCNYGASATVPAIFTVEIAGSFGVDTSGSPGFIENFQASVGSGVGAVTSGNLTPSVSSGLIVAVTMDSNLADTMTVDTAAGFTDLFAAAAFWQFTDGVNHGAASTQAYTTATPVAALFTASGTNSSPGTLAALFATRSAPFAPLTIGLGTTPNDGTGDPARTAFSELNLMEAQLYGVRSVQAPTTGFTVAAAHGVTQLVLTPAGTLATGTVTFPPFPGDNQPFELVTSQTVTALTLNTSDGSTIASSPTTITAAAAIRYRFIASLNKWFRER